MPSGIWSLTMLLPDIAQISFTPLRITFCFRTIERYDIFTRYTSLPSIIFCPFDFFLKDFNLWLPLLMIALYYQIKTSIDFWCKQELNSDSLDCFSYFFSVCWIINIYYSTQTKKKKKKGQGRLTKRKLGPLPISDQGLRDQSRRARDGDGPELLQKAAQRARRWAKEFPSLLSSNKRKMKIIKLTSYC